MKNITYMKAWEDVEERYGPKLYSTKVSRYWIQDGIKIEKFNSGEIILKNYNVPGDISEPVGEKHMDMFINAGWEAGICSVCIEVFTVKMNQAKINLKESSSDRERKTRQKRYDFMVKTLDSYYDRINAIK